MEPTTEDAIDPSGDRRELLGFYDRVRRRVLDHVERRGPRLGRRLAETLLLVPDVLLLLVRLLLDPEVPRQARAVVGGGLAYFLLPFDVVPEILVGAPGYVEDLLVATTVLACALGDDLERYAERHWSGPSDVRRALGDLGESASQLVGLDIEKRVERVVARRLKRGRRAPRATF
ncbi:MAG: DUF1232 domain-containing protein [Thermoanaerobaculia bacterium]|nr:DUF1232 domain-containing protein [Thermoanaerobaculia bacterium]